MARDRLAGLRANQGQNDSYNQLNTPNQPAYPPQQQQQNPYAQQERYQQQPQQVQQQYQQPFQQPNPQQYEMQQTSYNNGGGAQPQPVGDFWQEIGDIRTHLTQLKESINQIRGLHAQSLNSTTGPPQELSALIEETRQMSQEIKAKIKAVNVSTGGDKGKKMQVKGVKEQFMTLLNEYQTVEKTHRSKVKQRAERQYKIVKPEATPQEIEQVLESDNPQIFQQALLSSNRYGQANSAYKEVQQRHEDIKRIEQTLTELAQLFNDMAMLIEQQDETIVVVEQNAAGVNKDMEEGSRQLDVAIKSAKAARRKRWICFWIIVLILIAIAAIVAAVVVTQNQKK